MDNIKTIRDMFVIMLNNKSFVPDRTGTNTIEVLGAQFVADEPTIFGAINEKYITREIGWYMSRSLSINDMEPPVPKLWKSIASKDGFVNSNYGFLVFDPKNHSQIDHCIVELKNNKWSRRAIMIYTRPSMWEEYNLHGRSDFICTNTVQYFIRQGLDEVGTDRIFAKVDMRSNDVWSGYRNDYAWQVFVFNSMFSALKRHYPNLRRGVIIWNVGSLHVYERNFDLVQHYIDTGDFSPHPEKLLETRNRLVKEGIIRE